MKTEMYQKTVLGIVNGDKNHGWGIADSMAVIAAIYKDETGEELPSEAREQIKSVVNPAAFHQILSKQGVLAPMEKRGERTQKAFLQFDVAS